ncbi:hypothetical protein BCR32DRAFT_269572 [Anaeromyces robustus]|uniref:P-loop containing nucleoside triphosphate hydrolase protein n=1 Tax=Anaeromyces robustus TaxID=1754192 RepID=A0A1Y1X0S2_9FUNG|nr:hypothetical protein BCR32DRAFT_269572 [Anaeromyces robustus]|eukprot:ORX79265.1 hypothetical protein BCR32DRAFT_269572 [Anaeromyces robustus]
MSILSIFKNTIKEKILIAISILFSIYQGFAITGLIYILRCFINSLITLVKYHSLKDITKINDDKILNDLIETYVINQNNNNNNNSFVNFEEKYPNIDINNILNSFNSSQYTFSNGISSLEFKTKDTVTQELYQYVKLFIIITIILFILSFISEFLINHVFSQYFLKLISLAYKKNFNDGKFINHSIIGGHIDYAKNRLNIIENIGSQITNLCLNYTFLILSVVMCLYINWKISLILFFINYLIQKLFYILMIPGAKYYSKSILKYEEAKNVAKESLENIKSISIFGKEEKQINIFNDKLKQYSYKLKRRVFILGMSLSLTCFSSNILYWLIYIKGGKYINDGILKGGDIVAITLYLLNIDINIFSGLDKNIKKVIREFNYYTHEDKDFNKNHYINVKNDEKQDEKQKRQIHGDIDILDCHLQPGKVVAFIGDYNTSYCHIYSCILEQDDKIKCKIDGQDIKEYNIHDLSSQIGVVPETIVLFNGTIAENISITNPNATQQQIEDVAKLVNAHEFISQLPKGYQTVLHVNDDDDDDDDDDNDDDNNEINLSISEKQRICFARALIHNPKILFIDCDMINYLDDKSQKIIEQLLKDNVEKTIILTSSYQTMNDIVKISDCIYVMEDYKIIESGTHKELMAKKESYYKNINKIRIFENNLSSSSSSSSSSSPSLTNDNNNNEKKEFFDTTTISSLSSSDKKELINMNNSFNINISSERNLLNNNNNNKKELNKSEKSKKNSNDFRKYKRGLLFPKIIIFFTFIGIGIIQPYIGILFGYGIYTSTEIIGKELLKDSQYWGKMFLLIGLITFIFIGIDLVNTFYIGEKLNYRIRRDMFKSMIYQDMSYFDKKRVSPKKTVFESISNDDDYTKNNLNDNFEIESLKDLSLMKQLFLNEKIYGIKYNLVGILISLLLCFTYAFMHHKSMATYLFIYTIIITLLSLLLQIFYVIQVNIQYKDCKKIMNKYFNKKMIINHMILTKLLILDHRFVYLFNEELKKHQKKIDIKHIIVTLKYCLNKLLQVGNFAICLYIGYLFYSKDQIDFLNMIKIVLIVAFTCSYVRKEIILTINVSMREKNNINNIMEIINRKPKIRVDNNNKDKDNDDDDDDNDINDSKKGNNIKDVSLRGKITFNDIYLKVEPNDDSNYYVSSGKKPIEIPEGKTVAIVGSNRETVKRMLLGLIPRWYDVDRGEVLIDDHPVTDYNLKWLREQICYIGKDAELLSMSIKENIKYGSKKNESVTEEEMKEAAKKADIHDYIVSLPSKYLTNIQDVFPKRNQNQSTIDLIFGPKPKPESEVDIERKKKIAIARAIIHQPKILLLNEPLKGLKNEECKMKVKKVLKNLSKDCTTIIATEDLESIKDVDKIIVMDGSKIVEVGNHKELVNLKGYYYRIIKKPT